MRGFLRRQATGCSTPEHVINRHATAWRCVEIGVGSMWNSVAPRCSTSLARRYSSKHGAWERVPAHVSSVACNGLRCEQR